MRKHKGFTLVELVVVVMILGILAAVAAPKLLGTSATATQNATKHSLAILRDAVERYAAQNGGQLPPTDSEANFKAALQPLLRGGVFPTCPADGVATVTIDGTNPSLTVNGTSGGWVFCEATGEIGANSAGYISY